jgi:hypothetical protein
MSCCSAVPISTIPPVGQGVGPLVYANGNQMARLNPPLNPSFVVYDGSVTRWGDGSNNAPIFLPALEEIQTTSGDYLVGITPGGQLIKSQALSGTNLIGGGAGEVPYQTASSTTAFTAVGIAGQVLTSGGTGSPTWQNSILGNAGSATILQTGRTIGLSGDVSATGVSFNGSADITLSTSIGTGVVTSNNIANGTIVDLDINASAGIANSKLAGNPTTANTASTIVLRDGAGSFSAQTITASLSGNATSATNIAGGGVGSVPYQTASSTTTTLPIGSANQVLTVNAGGTAPAWVTGTIGVTTNSNAPVGYVGEWLSNFTLSSSPITLTSGIAQGLDPIALTAGDWDVSCNGEINLTSATLSFAKVAIGLQPFIGTGTISNGAGNAGVILNITGVTQGRLAIGTFITGLVPGVGVVAGTYITAFGSGSGGIGTYTVSVSQNVASSTIYAPFVLPNGSLDGSNSFISNANNQTTVLGITDICLATKTTRVSLATTTNIYCVSYAVFSSGAIKTYGNIEARRVR